jgi:hypothetical protein
MNDNSHMGIPSPQFDEFLADMLRTDAIVTCRQRDAAWEQVQQQAAAQMILPPYAVPPRPAAPPPEMIDRLARSLLRVIDFLLVEDPYHRAAANRNRLPIARVIGADMIVHYYPPVRYHNSDPRLYSAI